MVGVLEGASQCRILDVLVLGQMLDVLLLSFAFFATLPDVNCHSIAWAVSQMG